MRNKDDSVRTTSSTLNSRHSENNTQDFGAEMCQSCFQFGGNLGKSINVKNEQKER